LTSSRARQSIALVAALTLALVAPASAQPVKIRVLKSLEIAPRDDGWSVAVTFTLPARLVSFSPAEIGDLVRVRVGFPAVPEDQQRSLAKREALTPPPKSDSPLDQVVYDGTDPAGPTVEVRFRERVRFRVQQGADFRSIVVLIQPLSTARAPARERVDSWMEMAQDAMTAGEFERAALIYTKVLSAPGDYRKPEARELLGLAYERDGKLPHAVAEYETYLREYSDAEGASRVRQRLRAIVTGGEEEPAPLREAERQPSEVEATVFGSISTTLARADSWPDGEGHMVSSFEQLGDLFATGLIDTPGWRFRPEAAIRGRYDYEQSELGDGRVSTLQLEASQAQPGFSGILGRQSRSRGGVLGRFDGALASYRFDDWIQVNAVGGFPLDSDTADTPDTSRKMGGASVEFFAFDDRVDLELYGIYQRANGYLDREAVGAELHYNDTDVSSVVAVDYDVHYQSLNTAVLVWQWQLVERLGLNGVAEYRNTPYLFTRNALIGQDANSLNGLNNTYSTSEIEDLARDRTRRELNLTMGGYGDLTSVWQLQGDFTVSHLGGTPTSGGVEGENAPGWEYLESLQVSRSDFFTQGDVWTAGARWFQGADFDSYSLIWTGRWPLFDRKLSVLPRARVTFRDPDSGNQSVGFLAATRLDWQFWKFVIELETGVDRSDDLQDNNDEWGVFVDATLRFDF